MQEPQGALDLAPLLVQEAQDIFGAEDFFLRNFFSAQGFLE